MNVLPAVVILAHLSLAAEADEIMNGTLTRSLDPESTVPALVKQRQTYYTTKYPLYCPPCEQLHCYVHPKKQKLQCKGGYTVGICGCCRVCAKVENEQCGGEHNYLGRCDKGLMCEPLPPKEVTFLNDGVKTVYRVEKGICKRAPAKTRNFNKCKPKCDPDYCMKNPRAICSARENMDVLRLCQGYCQHTSCRACRFLEPEMDCPKCVAGDFKCIRDFGRCIRKKSCKPKAYPCGGSLTKIANGYKHLTNSCSESEPLICSTII